MSIKYNPFTGNLDLVGSNGIEDVTTTIIEREAFENISALKMVIVNLDNTVSLADSASAFEDAKTIGMALSAATAGNMVRIATFGVVEDISFTYSANDQLYLSSNGDIKITAPATPTDTYNVFIGQALGSGQIFINIQEPTEL